MSNVIYRKSSAGHTCLSILFILILFLAPQRQQSARAELNVNAPPDLNPEVAELFQKAWKAYQDQNILVIMPLLNQALEKSRAVGDKAGETFSLFAFSEVYKKLGAVDKADEYEKQARSIMEAGGDKAKAANIATAMGTAYVAIGQERRAVEFYQQALKLYRDMEDRNGEAAALILLGNVQGTYLGQSQTALTLYEQALAISRATGSQQREAEALYYIGSTQNQPAEAMEYYRQALALWRKLDDEANQARALYRISECISDEHIEEKLQILQQALELQRVLNEKRIRQETKLSTVGDFINKRQEVTLLLAAGTLQAKQKNLQVALESFQKSLNLSTEIGYKVGRAANLYAISDIYNKMQQPQKELEFLQQAMQLYRESENKPVTVSMLFWLAIREESQGRLADAEAHRVEGLTLLEELRESIGGQSMGKMGFLEEHLHHYQAHIDSLLKTGEATQAFAWAEKTKARALIDLLYSGKVDISKDISPTERAQELTLRQQVELLNQQLIAATANDPRRVEVIKPRLAQAEVELQRFTGVLYAEYPGLAQKRAAQTVTVEDIAKFLPEDTVLLNYVALNKTAENNIVLFAVTNEGGKGSVKSYVIKTPVDELLELLDDFRNACADPQKSYKSKARDLYNVLLSPAAAQMIGKQRIVICPDGPLWGTPFQALIKDDQFLQEQYEVTYAYSATAAQAALVSTTNSKRTRPAKTLLALANPDFGGPERFNNLVQDTGAGPSPDTSSTNASSTSTSSANASRPIVADGRAIIADSRAIGAESRGIENLEDKNPLRAILSRDGGIKPLPGTQREAEALLTNFPDATIDTGAQAQESTAKQEGDKYRYLHFATHGLFNDTAPLLSSVVLAKPAPGSTDDGFLTAREIFDLNWNADMVVLSACDTGRGTKRSGEGIIGLTWAVFVAGVPTQLVSQWAVNDDSTAELMKHFYTQLKNGKSKGTALREANLMLMRDGQHNHPFYWAPFILLGDWRN